MRPIHHSSVNEKTKSSGPSFPRAVRLGREVCGNLTAAESREWLVTNGIGGYASGTVAGHLTRCYHGLLIAALRPPLGRALLVAKLEEIALYAGRSYELATNRWAGGTVAPEGFRHIEEFHLEGTTPVWTFALGDALLQKRVFMQRGANATYVHFRFSRGSEPVQLTLKALVNDCAFHCVMQAGNGKMDVSLIERGVRVRAWEGPTPLYVRSSSGEIRAAGDWYRNFDLAAERARGLVDRCDHFLACEFDATLAPGATLTVVASTDATTSLDGDAALAARVEAERERLSEFSAANPAVSTDVPEEIAQLILAADQFIVARPLPNAADARSVIAGYHWFGDWGRDTMVSLPGLTISAGRPEIAANILRTYSRFVRDGLLPNAFGESGEATEYNTVDAALWYVHAVREYFRATQDLTFLRELFPVLAGILAAYVRGTRYGIQVDPNDGLLGASDPGIQLTWMDAKAGEWVVTPRRGKPVEVNALWLNAAAAMAEFSRAIGESPAVYDALARRAGTGFQRFWNAPAGFCFDVLDGPEGNDAALRPNQIFAVSLPESPLNPAQQRAVVEICARELLTSHGLRSLGPREPNYHGKYDGGPAERDAVYHQGTVWGWLMGHFALAHLRVYNDPSLAASFLEPMMQHIRGAGLGTLSEIFDGDAPFTPRGCIAQAWTVAEILRAWTAISAARRIS